MVWQVVIDSHFVCEYAKQQQNNNDNNNDDDNNNSLDADTLKGQCKCDTANILKK
jgi:hypothetical protein